MREERACPECRNPVLLELPQERFRADKGLFHQTLLAQLDEEGFRRMAVANMRLLREGHVDGTLQMVDKMRLLI